MTTVLTVLFGVAFFLALMACVALHEVGHLVPAKLAGVRVPAYFVGFGRTLWSTRRGDTEYGVKLFPLGGFVRLLGMYPPRRSGSRDGWLQRLADDARAAEWEDITPDDRGRLFYEQRTGVKLAVMSGGIVMNLLLAFVLSWAVTGLHGVYRTQPVVAGIQACLIPADEAGRACAAGDPPSPAARAGLTEGDRILSFNGIPVRDYPQLTALIRANGSGEARLTVERDGAQQALPVVHTVLEQRPDTLDPGRLVPAGFLGVLPTVVLQKGGPLEVLGDLRTAAAQSLVTLAQFPVKVFRVVADMATGRPRDVTGPISVVGASVVAGQSAAAPDGSASDKAASFVSLLASVNLFLAMFNLVPLPPLDGGHLAGALYEAARRALARLAGRPDPGPADTAKMLPVAYAVGGFLLLCGIALIVADIVSPVKLF